MRTLVSAAVALVAIATPAAAQTTHDIAELGFTFDAPGIYEVSQEGIRVTAAYEDLGEFVEIMPFSVLDPELSRTDRMALWFEIMGYDFFGAEEVRGDGEVLVTGEGGDEYTVVVVRDLYVDSDGGLRVTGEADSSDPSMVLDIVNSVRVTDPALVMRAGRQEGQID